MALVRSQLLSARAVQRQASAIGCLNFPTRSSTHFRVSNTDNNNRILAAPAKLGSTKSAIARDFVTYRNFDDVEVDWLKRARQEQEYGDFLKPKWPAESFSSDGKKARKAERDQHDGKIVLDADAEDEAIERRRLITNPFFLKGVCPLHSPSFASIDQSVTGLRRVICSMTRML